MLTAVVSRPRTRIDRRFPPFRNFRRTRLNKFPAGDPCLAGLVASAGTPSDSGGGRAARNLRFRPGSREAGRKSRSVGRSRREERAPGEGPTQRELTNAVKQPVADRADVLVHEQPAIEGPSHHIVHAVGEGQSGTGLRVAQRAKDPGQSALTRRLCRSRKSEGNWFSTEANEGNEGSGKDR
jgi:hypothetical protein